MKLRQQGLSLVAVAVGMALLAAVAMAAMFSMRQERNLFAAGLDKAGAAARDATAAAAPPAAPLRKCTINGKTVISNTDCGAAGSVVPIHDSRGIEPPKAAPAPPPQDNLRQQMIERASRQ